MGPMPQLLKDRFWGKVAKIDDSDCWEWLGQLNTNGYGVVYLSRIECNEPNRRLKMAHRIAYEFMVGPIPHTLTIDHLCKNTRCVNPRHMEPVTRGENTLRGNTTSAKNKMKVYCPKGHMYSESNTYLHKRKNNTISRDCKICTDNRQAVYNAKVRKGTNV